MKEAWYVAERAGRLGAGPVAVEVCGEAMVLFRDPGQRAVALHDRCAHRGVALSRGRLKQGCVQCPYHGWTFDGQGRCVEIPANQAPDAIPTGAVVRRFEAVERDGFIWVWPGEGQPDRPPAPIPHMVERGWAWVRMEAEIAAPVEAVVENFIDNPHTGYIHGGLFRTPASHLTTHRISTAEDGVVIDIEEEAQSKSLLGRLLLQDGMVVQHQDRFLSPATVRVSYTFGKRQAIGWQFCTPVDGRRTRVFVHVAWSAGWLTGLIRPFVTIVGRTILAQDKTILDHQGAQLERHGRRFCSTAADTANLWIDAFRRRAEAGQPQPAPHDKRVSFRV